MDEDQGKKEDFCWCIDYLYGERLPKCEPCRHCACQYYAKVKQEDDEHD